MVITSRCNAPCGRAGRPLNQSMAGENISLGTITPLGSSFLEGYMSYAGAPGGKMSHTGAQGGNMSYAGAPGGNMSFAGAQGGKMSYAGAPAGTGGAGCAQQCPNWATESGGAAAPSRAGSPNRSTRVTRVEKTPTGIKRTTSETKVYDSTSTQTSEAGNIIYHAGPDSPFQTTPGPMMNDTYNLSPAPLNATSQSELSRADAPARRLAPVSNKWSSISDRVRGPQAQSTPTREFAPYSYVTQHSNIFDDWAPPDEMYNMMQTEAAEPEEAQDFSGLSYLQGMQNFMEDITPLPADASSRRKMRYLDRIESTEWNAVGQEFYRRLNRTGMDLSFYERQRMHLLQALHDLELRYAMVREMMQRGKVSGLGGNARQ